MASRSAKTSLNVVPISGLTVLCREAAPEYQVGISDPVFDIMYIIGLTSKVPTSRRARHVTGSPTSIAKPGGSPTWPLSLTMT